MNHRSYLPELDRFKPLILQTMRNLDHEIYECFIGCDQIKEVQPDLSGLFPLNKETHRKNGLVDLVVRHYPKDYLNRENINILLQYSIDTSDLNILRRIISQYGTDQMDPILVAGALQKGCQTGDDWMVELILKKFQLDPPMIAQAISVALKNRRSFEVLKCFLRYDQYKTMVHDVEANPSVKYWHPEISLPQNDRQKEMFCFLLDHCQLGPDNLNILLKYAIETSDLFLMTRLVTLGGADLDPALMTQILQTGCRTHNVALVDLILLWVDRSMLADILSIAIKERRHPHDLEIVKRLLQIKCELFEPIFQEAMRNLDLIICQCFVEIARIKSWTPCLTGLFPLWIWDDQKLAMLDFILKYFHLDHKILNQLLRQDHFPVIKILLTYCHSDQFDPRMISRRLGLLCQFSEELTRKILDEMPADQFDPVDVAFAREHTELTNQKNLIKVLAKKFDLAKPPEGEYICIFCHYDHRREKGKKS